MDAQRRRLRDADSRNGLPARAIRHLQRALTDRVRVLGEDHPDTLASRNSLAGAYRSVGDLGRAVPLFE
ncbi:tetratricopeptide repeat protein [Streptomyces sp. NPDC000994]